MRFGCGVSLITDLPKSPNLSTFLRPRPHLVPKVASLAPHCHNLRSSLWRFCHHCFLHLYLHYQLSKSIPFLNVRFDTPTLARFCHRYPPHLYLCYYTLSNLFYVALFGEVYKIILQFIF